MPVERTDLVRAEVLAKLGRCSKMTGHERLLAFSITAAWDFHLNTFEKSLDDTWSQFSHIANSQDLKDQIVNKARTVQPPGILKIGGKEDSTPEEWDLAETETPLDLDLDLELDGERERLNLGEEDMDLDLDLGRTTPEEEAPPNWAFCGKI